MFFPFSEFLIGFYSRNAENVLYWVFPRFSKFNMDIKQFNDAASCGMCKFLLFTTPLIKHCANLKILLDLHLNHEKRNVEINPEPYFFDGTAKRKI